MATSLWLVYTTDMPSYAANGDPYARLDGTNQAWTNRFLRASRATSGPSVQTATTVAGPTNGIETLVSSQVCFHVSPPLAADVTISGTIACNLWAAEDSMSANATVGVRIMRMAAATGALTEVGKGIYGTELTTASAVCTFNITPTSTAFNRGDRIVAIPYFDDATATTMGASYTATFYHSATSAGVSGDSYITFNETLTFESAPAGTYIYPTNTALGTDVNSQSVEKEAWTSRGGGVQSALTYMPDGYAPAVPIASSTTRTGQGSVTTLLAFGDTTTDKVAQSFTTPAGTPYIYEIRPSFGVDASGSPTDNIVVEVQADSGGVPSGTALASVTVPNAVAARSPGPHQIYLDAPLSVSASTTYWMVISRSGSASAVNFWKAYHYITSSTYAGGAYYKYASGSWTAVNYDAQFWVYWTGYLEWYTKRLAATTLSGPVLVNYRGKTSSTIGGAIPRCEIAVVNNDGTGVTVWGVGGSAVKHASTENALQFWVAGDDLSVSDGQRIRIRFLCDDTPGGGNDTLVLSETLEHTFYWAGASGATGDTYLRFTSGVSFTEYSGGTTVSDDFTANAVLLKNQTPTGFTLNAVIRKNQTGTPFNLDAQFYHPGMLGSFKVDAWLRTTTSGFFNANAVLLKGMTGTPFTLDAVILAGSGTKTFTVDAWKSGIFTLYALIVATMQGTGFKLDAWVVSPTRTFTVDAVLRTRRLFGTDVVYPTPLAPAHAYSGSAISSPNDVFDAVWHLASVPFESSVYGQGEVYGQWLPGSVFGQQEQFWAWRPLVIYPGWTIQGVVAEAKGLHDHSSVSFSLEAYQYTWWPPRWPTIQTVDYDLHYKTSAWAQSHTVLATFNTDNFVAGAWNRFSGDLTSIVGTTMNGGSRTELIVLSDHFRQRIVAGGDEYVAFDHYPEADMPRLAVTVSANTGFTLDALIKPVYHFTVDAWIGAVGVRYSSFQAYAAIRKSQQASFTLDAHMYEAGKGRFTLDAVIKTTFLFGTDFRVYPALSRAGNQDYYNATLGDSTYAILLAANESNGLADGTSGGGADNIGQWRDPDWPNMGMTNYLNAEMARRWARAPKRAGETFSNIVLKHFADGDFSSTDFTVEARYSQWTIYSPYTYYLKQTDFAAAPLLASLASSGISIPAYNTFTSDANLATYFVTEGGWEAMGVIFGSSRFRLGSGIGTATEYVVFDDWYNNTDYPARIEASVSRLTGFTLNAELRPNWHFHVDAWVAALGTKYGSFQAYATLFKKMSGSFTLDAYKAFRFTIDAHIAPHFHLDAIKLKPWTKTFVLDAEMVPHQFTLDAIVNSGSRGLFQLYAIIARNTFTLDAELGHGGLFTLDALLKRSQAGTAFTLDAFIFNGTTRQRQTTLDAVVLKNHWKVFAANAQIERVITTVTGSAPVDAVCDEVFAAAFTLDAVIGYRVLSGSFPVDADIRGASEQRGSFTLAASLVRVGRGLFAVDALVAQAIFRIDAHIGPRFTLDAQLKATLADTFTLDAWLIGRFTLDAIIAVSGSSWAWGGSFTVSAIVADTNGAWPGREVTFTLDALIIGPAGPQPPFTLDALIRSPHAAGFTLDAWKAGRFTLNAWIGLGDGSLYGGTFRIDAYIAGNDFIIWPDEQTGGDGSTPDTSTFTSPSATFNEGMVGSTIFINGVPYTIVAVIDEHTITITPVIVAGQSGLPWEIQPGSADSNGDPIPSWFKARRKYRVNITLDGTDVTEDVIWSRTTFTQNAKTNPGTFELTLKGVHAWDGGEETLVSLDDFRVFGGYVLSVEKGYVFDADAGDPITILRGADFNVLLDKLIVYNKASADDPSGFYINWKTFKVGTLDTTIINKVFGSYVDLPAGFDYTTYVESVGVAALEKPWAMPQAGSPLRQVLQSLSQSTNAIWWVSPYMRLHYGSRTTVTAPFPITDGLGGISSRNLSYQSDMSMLITEARLWGTLAYTVEGEVMTNVERSSWYDIVGPWQHGEFRSDLHHQSFINRRVDSIIERYGKPIERAKAIIFDPGYQAGQVAQVKLSSYGIDGVLPIRSLALTFAVAKEPKDGHWYCVPRFELSVGIDPEEPWDIYDYLPFPDDKGTPYEPRHRRNEEECLITDSYRRDDMIGGWGKSTSKVDWVVNYGEPEWVSVHNQTGRILLPVSTELWSGNYVDMELPFLPQQGESFDLSFDLTIMELTGEYSYVYASWGSSQFGIDMEGGEIGLWLDGSSWGEDESDWKVVDLRLGVTYHVTWTCMAGCSESLTLVPLSDDVSIPVIAVSRAPEFVSKRSGWTNAFYMGAGNESLTGPLDVRFKNLDIRAVGVSPCELILGNDNYLTRQGSWAVSPHDYNLVETYYGFTADADILVASTTNANGNKAYDETNIRHYPWPGFYVHDPLGAQNHLWRWDFFVHEYPEGTLRAELKTTIVAHDWTSYPDVSNGGHYVVWHFYDGNPYSWDTDRNPFNDYGGNPNLADSPGTYLGNTFASRLLITIPYAYTDTQMIHTPPGPYQMVPITYTMPLGADGKVRFVAGLEPLGDWPTEHAIYGYMFSQYDIDHDLPGTARTNNYPPYTHYEITYYCNSHPTYAVNVCVEDVDDTEGEVFGMVGQGWNVETVLVNPDGTFETTARVTRGTVLVYDNEGRWLQPRDEWEYASGDGQHFALVGVSHTRVTVCYRAWIQNIRSEYSVPRDVDPSWGPKRIPF